MLDAHWVSFIERYRAERTDALRDAIRHIDADGGAPERLGPHEPTRAVPAPSPTARLTGPRFRGASGRGSRGWLFAAGLAGAGALVGLLVLKPWDGTRAVGVPDQPVRFLEVERCSSRSGLHPVVRSP
ncbi:hypothetical protein [Streptomyces sp. NPDC058612]|uniref:hypothetical protein n=1 Tax=Streptomyces sp. NPDC058612 TaxID=3346555 RepID=UPI00364A5BD8